MAAGTVVSSVAEFGENLFTLTELQAKLAALELRHNLNATKAGATVILGGIALALAGLPLALLGIAELCVSELGFKRGYALLGVAGGAILGGSLLVGSVILLLRNRSLGFPLTMEEFSRNLNWVRSVIMHSGRLQKR
jgi:hypothetical protein